jgi:hypothetical protein
MRSGLNLSSTLASLRVAPSAGNGAELQPAFAPFQVSELAGFNLVLQILGGLEERGFEGVVSGLGVKGRPMNQQRGLPRMAGGFGVHARSRNLQPHLDAERRFGFALVFKHYFGRGDRREAMQVFEPFLNLTVPGGLGVETEIPKSGFHIRSRRGFVVAADATSSVASTSTCSDARTGDCARPLSVPAQPTLTSICCGFAFAVFAKCTASTPSLNSALTFAGLASSGIEKLRTKLP